MQARDLGLEIAAVRAEEIQQLLDQAAKDAVGDKRVPLGIPPQRAKTALVKPDPKAKPFMPGKALRLKAHFCSYNMQCFNFHGMQLGFTKQRSVPHCLS